MFILIMWLCFAVPASVFAAPFVAFTRRRAHWEVWELAALVLPFLVLLFAPNASEKGLGNLFTEPVYLALFVPLAALIRCLVWRKPFTRLAASTLIIGLCGAAIFISYTTPWIGE